MIKHCVICGTEFKENPNNKKITCSRECSLQHRSNINKGQPRPWSEKKWTLLSPDNVKYEITNLEGFIRENPELFDGTIEQARSSISKLKCSLKGTTKCPVSQWKGWRLIDYED